jgi:hypothetical protein
VCTCAAAVAPSGVRTSCLLRASSRALAGCSSRLRRLRVAARVCLEPSTDAARASAWCKQRRRQLCTRVCTCVLPAGRAARAGVMLMPASAWQLGERWQRGRVALAEGRVAGGAGWWWAHLSCVCGWVSGPVGRGQQGVDWVGVALVPTPDCSQPNCVHGVPACSFALLPAALCSLAAIFHCSRTVF